MEYKAVESEFEELIVISRSKFITTLIPITSQEDAQEKLKIIKKKYSDATHNCYAYISSENAQEQKFSDDGEPQGTAGAPILEVLKKKKVYMTLAVVTRYFGGIKLGASGLVGAYSSCVASAIDKAKIVEYKESIEIIVNTDYSTYKKLQEIIENNEGKVLNIDYSDNIVINAVIVDNKIDDVVAKIVDTSNGKAQVKQLEKKYNKFI